MKENLIAEKKIKRIKYRKIMEHAASNDQSKIFNTVIKSLKKIVPLERKERHLGIYWPLKGEIDLRGLKGKVSLKIALPACLKKNHISYHPWGENDLGKDFLNIPAPIKERKLSPKDLSVLLLPAISIDNQGNRLGYGGGYFDRLRSDPLWMAIPTFVVLPQSCVSSEPLPKGDWDIPVDGWISEDGLYKIKVRDF